MESQLFAVVVNWNLPEDTAACADSLFTGGLQPGNLVVVDNGSTDGSAEIFAGRYGNRAVLVQLEENLGFTGGANAGIRAALEQGAEWVLLVNNDTLVDGEMVRRLLQAAKNGPYDLLGPAIYYFDSPWRVWFFGHRLVAGTLFTREISGKGVSTETGDPVDVDFLSGCGLLVRREVFEGAGLFDTSLFMYGEEVDFCWRARLAGFRQAAVPGAKMWHKVSLSANRDKPKTRRIRVRNQVWFYRRYAGGLQKPVMFAGSLARLIGMALRDLLRGDGKGAAAHWEGWRAGWFGKLPEYPKNSAF